MKNEPEIGFFASLIEIYETSCERVENTLDLFLDYQWAYLLKKVFDLNKKTFI